MEDYKKLNLAYWNELAQRHLDSPFYSTAAFRKGEIILDPDIRARVGDVKGKRLLHLQCHFGLDTLSLARMGAEVTGLDFSDDAIKQARMLAAEAGIEATFVQSDVLNPPERLKDFDIVFASWGAICWIHDMKGWMRTAANALKPGGRLFLAEGHPVMLMIDEFPPAPVLPFTLRYPYDSDTPLELENQGDYAGPGEVKAHRNVQHLHGLGRILNAAIGAGLRIDRLDEGDRVPWAALPQLVKTDDDEYWTLPPGAPFVPLAFYLDATKL
jgi:SAM-dependent methyltransferase